MNSYLIFRWLLALSVSLVALPAFAYEIPQTYEEPPLPPQPLPPPPSRSLTPEQIQEQDQPELDEQQLFQDQSIGQMMNGKSDSLMSQCRFLLKAQWRYPGRPHFLTAKVVRGSRVSVAGTVSLPGAQGQPETHHYQCYLNDDRNAIKSARLGQHVVH